ncbi:MAG: hypothetical protein HC904_07505 [Blastochloris sp.]|nr:hypothetical protein [Blastochloris sp.]
MTLHLKTLTPRSLFFFPYREDLLIHSAEQVLTTTPDGSRLLLTLQEKTPEFSSISGVLAQPGQPEQPGIEIDLPLSPASPIHSGPASSSGWGTALLFGFLGGLILNLMPCVFPVLGLKVMSIVQQSGQDRRKVAQHGLSFTAGVLISFWLLAGVLLLLRAGGQELGWGFQLQSPGFVYVLLLIMLVFGLNLSGVFEMGASLVGVGSQLTARDSWLGSFFSGVLATVVATPCAATLSRPGLGCRPGFACPALPRAVLRHCPRFGLPPFLLLSLQPRPGHLRPARRRLDGNL